MLKKILFVLNKKEINSFTKISFFVFLGVFIEMLSFAIIIPVFNILFSDTIPDNNFVNYFDNSRDFLGEKNFKIGILALMLFIFLFKNIYLIFLNYFNRKLFYLINIRLSNSLFSLYLRQNYSFFLDIKSENLLRKSTTDIVGFQTFLSAFQGLIAELVLLFCLSILLLKSNYIIFLFCFFVFLTIIFLYVKIVKQKIKNWSYAYQKNIGDLQNLITEGVRGIKDIFVYKLENFFSKKFEYSVTSTMIPFFKIDFINNVQRFWMELLAVISITAPMIFFVYYDVNINELIPTFVLFSISIFRIVPSFNRIILNYQNIKFFLPSVNVIHKEFSDLQPNNAVIDKNLEFKKTIELKNVSFSYNQNAPALFTNLNIKILKGQTIAFLGQNGSGKSTLLNILSGLIAPSTGKIIIDNDHDICSNKKSWLNNISYVQQNIFLINASIKRNIMLEDENTSNSKFFLDICNFLYLEKMFGKLPDKLETVVGNDGLYLSGGQKQLISIARALYKNTEIVIFDEASSALDKDYSTLLRNVITSLKGKKTLIIVTHDQDFPKKYFDLIYKIESKNLILLKNDF